MRRVRQRATEPELAVRSVLRQLGVAYRLNCANLPGRPDFANRSRGWAIFVHGCFWHGHRRCRRRSRLVPRTNQDWWIDKIAANRARDVRKAEQLRRLGLRVLTVWECSLQDRPKVLLALARFLDVGR